MPRELILLGVSLLAALVVAIVALTVLLALGFLLWNSLSPFVWRGAACTLARALADAWPRIARFLPRAIGASAVVFERLDTIAEPRSNGDELESQEEAKSSRGSAAFAQSIVDIETVNRYGSITVAQMIETDSENADT